MPLGEQYSTWVEVDLGAIENNVRFFSTRTKKPVMAVVKANAYGHGAVPVAEAALRGGAAWCAVARFEEALELRRAGLACPVLLLGFTPPSRIQAAISEELSLTVWEPEQVEQAAAAARRAGRTARLHLKVDTGMNRLGVQPESALDLARRIAQSPDVHLEGLFTHFARADEADQAPTSEQERIFQEIIAHLEAQGLRPPLVHAANSAASLAHPSAVYDLVRPGIALYGLKPSGQFALPAGLSPGLAWKTALSYVKIVPAGRGISYGHTYVTRAQERIGTLPVGYADGLRRLPGNQVLIAGRRVPVIGRVCMDQVMVLLDRVPEARAGDEVVLIGRQGGEQITADEIANRWGTISYEVVCGIGSRVPRIYPG